MSFLRFASLLLAVAVVCGCEGPRGKAVKVTPPSHVENAKSALKDMVSSGQTGSQIMMVTESVQEIKKTDAAKGDALLKDLDELNKAKTPDEVKAKAKAMIDKL
jgi:uncharacterized protein YycO